MPELETIQRDMATLAQVREEAAELALRVEAARLAAEQTDEAKKLAELVMLQSEAKMLLSDLEATIRAEAVEYFAATGEKKPVPGVAIKLFRVAVYDKGAARAWIRANAPALLTPDWKAFEKTAADMGGPIAWKDDPRAQFVAVQ